MSEMIFYERVVVLNDKTHGGLRVRPASSFAYAARTNSVPLLSSEFFEAAREYPIVFARGEAGPVMGVVPAHRHPRPQHQRAERRRPEPAGVVLAGPS